MSHVALLSSVAQHLLRARAPLAIACALALSACASDNDLVLADATRDADAARAARDVLIAGARDLRAAAKALCAAAPPPHAGGWKLADDAASIAATKIAWKDAQRAHQSIEAAVELFFPDLGVALGGSYEDALAVGPDPDLFDADGFVGLHALERVLWANQIPPSVVAVESALDGHAPAAFPADEAAAARFRDGLCARLVDDAAALEARLDGLALDSGGAYAAATGLLSRQVEKMIAAGEGRAESRYAGHTLADMGANLAGAKALHAVFGPWLATKPGGAQVDDECALGFARIEKEYAAFGSDALPYVPEDWDAENLTQSALASPFGHLYAVVANEANVSLDGSLGHAMGEVVTLLGVAYSGE